MSKFGLTEERYQQMLELNGGDESAVEDIVEVWTPKHCNKGYCIIARCLVKDIAVYCVERIQAVGAFPDDLSAAAAAEKDGIAFIPVNELPTGLPDRFRLPNFVDLRRNRKALDRTVARIKENAKKEVEASEIKGEISRDLFKIQELIDQIRNRTIMIPIHTADINVLRDFADQIHSLRVAAENAAVSHII